MEEQEKMAIFKQEVAKRNASQEPQTEEPQTEEPQAEEPQTEEPQTEEPQTEEPASGVVKEPKKESIAAVLSAMENRLKQSERRLGSIQNNLFNEKKLAKEKEKEEALKPTAEEKKASEEAEKRWEELREDFPELLVGIESKLSERDKAFSKEESKKLLKEMQEKVDSLSAEVEKSRLYQKHADFETVILTEEYNKWLAGQGDDIWQKTRSMRAEDAIFVLDAFKKTVPQKKPSSLRTVSGRLSQAAIPGSSSPTRTKLSEADLTDAEFRKKLLQQRKRG